MTDSTDHYVLPKVANTVKSAHYGFRFIPLTHGVKKSANERAGIKRMKKKLSNKGKMKFDRIIFTNTLDMRKKEAIMRNILNKSDE